MQYKINYSDFAESDLIDISDYLSQFYPSTLDRFLKAYDKRISLLTENPYAFRICFYNPEYRQVPVSDYIVFYKVIEEIKIVEIYRVLRSSRNIENIISNESGH